jgi:hypothetical protein
MSASVLGMRAGGAVATSRRLLAHAAAFLGAPAAGLGACLAVLGLVVTAFVCAGFAHRGAEGARRTVVCAAARHEGDGQAANLGAIDVERDAAGHRFGVRLLQASDGAVVTGIGTLVASFDAGLMV